MPPRWREEPLTRKHDRQRFDCGIRDLNGYLNRYARQNHESGGAKTFIAVEPATPEIVLGYYTVAPGSLEFARTPTTISKGLGRHDVLVYRPGRLAVDHRWQGQGLGSQLFAAAGVCCLKVSHETGGVAVVIDARDERVAQWFASFGALPVPDASLTLVLSLASFSQRE